MPHRISVLIKSRVKMKLIKKSISFFLRRHRLRITEYIYKDYDDNPFNIENNKIEKEKYQELAKRALTELNYDFIETIKKEFGYVIDHEFIHDLALVTQIVDKPSPPLYLHGYILYGSLRKYLEENANISCVNILETGTARGFSALVMAKAMDDAKRVGKIITLDILPTNRAIYWNCIQDITGKKKRMELLNKWREMVNEYILFLQGYSDVIIRQLEIPRVHFAFLDGAHDYETVKNELLYVSEHQSRGDVILCDDYTEKQYPGLVMAVNEFISIDKYNYITFHAGTTRGYLYCVKK